MLRSQPLAKNIILYCMILIGAFLIARNIYQASRINLWSLPYLPQLMETVPGEIEPLPAAHPRSVYWRSLQELEKGRSGEALALLQPLAGQGDKFALQLMGQAYESLGDLSAAIPIWQQTENSLWLKSLAKTAVADGHLDRALEAYFAIWELDPINGTGNLAHHLLTRMDDPHAAETILRQSLAQYQNVRQRYAWLVQLGDALSDQERWPEAIENYGQALAFNQSYGPEILERLDYQDRHFVSYQLAWAYHSAGQSDAAMDAIDSALILAPSRYNYLQRAGQIYEAAGDYENALAIYRQILTLKPDDKHALETVSRLEAK
jgi:tetratricopeptide (TPR) repeat protein